MSKLADSFSPQEISQLEIDDVLRDRLRFDPQWQEIAQLSLESYSSGFGSSLDLMYGTLAISSQFDNKFGASAGAVYVMTTSPSSSCSEYQTAFLLSNSQILSSPYPSAAEKFASSLTISDTYLAVGACGKSYEGNSTVRNSGAVYIYEYDYTSTRFVDFAMSPHI
jgi:hypothetical protein